MCKLVKLSKMEKYVELAAVYTAERFVLQGNFSEPQNPQVYNQERFQIKSGL